MDHEAALGARLPVHPLLLVKHRLVFEDMLVRRVLCEAAAGSGGGVRERRPPDKMLSLGCAFDKSRREWGRTRRDAVPGEAVPLRRRLGRERPELPRGPRGALAGRRAAEEARLEGEGPGRARSMRWVAGHGRQGGFLLLRGRVRIARGGERASRSFTRWSSAPSRLPCFCEAMSSTCMAGESVEARQQKAAGKDREQGRRARLPDEVQLELAPLRVAWVGLRRRRGVARRL